MLLDILLSTVATVIKEKQIYFSGNNDSEAYAEEKIDNVVLASFLKSV